MAQSGYDLNIAHQEDETNFKHQKDGTDLEHQKAEINKFELQKEEPRRDDQEGKLTAEEYSLLHIYDFGDPVNLSYEEIYQDLNLENNGSLGGKCVSRNVLKQYRHVFHWSQDIVYIILAVPLGVLLTVLWAIVFAINKLILVWLMQPVVKLLLTWISLFGFCYRVLVRTLLDPFCEALSLVFRIRRGIFNVSAKIDNNSTLNI